MSPAVRPVSPERLVEELVATVTARPGTLRVAVDGPPAARPGDLAAALVEPLRSQGRAAVHLPAELFWRDASLRLEHGREDVDAYLDWLDAPALQREVLRPVVERGEYLPSLRDPATNRSTRAAPVPAGEGTVVLVSGAFLLGLGLAFDLTVHLAVSPAARARRTPDDEAWTLPAFDRYDAEVDPAGLADLVVRCDDPRHPALVTS